MELPIEFQQPINISKEIQGLPPPRNVSYYFPLLHGAGSVNVRPYRYHHCQNNENESQVRYLMQEGVIRNSASVLSSPVILVKKKDSL